MLFTFASLKLSLHPLPFYLKSSLMVQEYFHEDDFDFVQLAGGVHGEISPTQDDILRGAYTLKRFWRDDRGTNTVEWVALIVLVAALVWIVLSPIFNGAQTRANTVDTNQSTYIPGG